MSDIVDDVERAIEQSPSTYDDCKFTGCNDWPTCNHQWRTDAISAITAAEPHFRRKHRQELLDELIADTVWMDAWARDRRQQERMSESRKTITDWLDSKKEAE